jgi:hypothetical protein
MDTLSLPIINEVAREEFKAVITAYFDGSSAPAFEIVSKPKIWTLYISAKIAKFPNIAPTN